MPEVAVRFAPSPTGRLHVGNARAALLNWLLARKHRGRFLLRIDDTDPGRSSDFFTTAIQEDLLWLGLEWDSFFCQRDRLSRYQEVAGTLREKGLLYPCHQAALPRRTRQHRRGRTPVRDQDSGQTGDGRTDGKPPHWRFRLSGGREEFRDLIRGRVSIDTGSLSDPVLVRSDGSPLYTLTSVIDDVDFGISHVIRGEDHLTNTAVQCRIFRALGLEPPVFGHFPLLLGEDGGKLSKRSRGSVPVTIAGLREDGLEPMAVNILLARIGSSLPVRPVAGLDELAATFEPGAAGRSPQRLDGGALLRLNAALLRETGYEAVRERLCWAPEEERLWPVIRNNIRRLSEAGRWRDIVCRQLVPVIRDEALVQQAWQLLPSGSLDDGSWSEWTSLLAARTGLAPRDIIPALRLALTGLENGPEMSLLLPLIGRDTALRRLRGQIA